MSNIMTAADYADLNASGLTTEEWLRARGHIPGRSEIDVTVREYRTDKANGERFAEIHGANVRYCPPMDKWFVFRGTHWEMDSGCKVESLAKQVAADVWQAVKDALPEVDKSEALDLYKFGTKTASAHGVSSMLRMARSEEQLTVQPEQLDKNPLLLNVQNGTIDLQTGKRRSHNKADLITAICPTVHCERAESKPWQDFLERIVPDVEVRGFLQRLAGYWLTGSTRDHVLPIFVGPGANGKSVYLNTIMAVMGKDYACQAPPDLLIVKRTQHPTEQAMLFGKRLVCSTETGEDNKLDEPRVKMLTGGEQITARRMKEDFWTFKATHKHAIGTNYLFKVSGTDGGIWRRLRKVVFGVVIPPEEQDKMLPEKLSKESTGIIVET